MSLPPALLAAGLLLLALCGGSLWALGALSTRERRAGRIAAVVAPHLPARAPAGIPQRRGKALRPLLLAAVRLFGANTVEATRSRVPPWAVVLGVLPAARVAAEVPALLVGPVAIWATPLLWVLLARAAFGWMRAARRAALFRQFPDALGMMVRMVRIGIPVTESLRLIARDSPKPTSEEFGAIADRLAVGLPLEEALRETALRNGVPEYRFFATALALQAQTGGALSEALDNLAEVIRKRIALRQRGYALASEARTSATILASLPFVTGGALALLSPEHIGMLFNDRDGQRILGIAIGLLGLGILVMRQIIRRALS